MTNEERASRDNLEVLHEAMGVKTYPIDSSVVNDALDDLKAFAYDFLDEEYGLPPRVKITLNSRLRNTGGQLVNADVIELNTRHVYNAVIFDNREEVEDTLKHELVHYALGVLGRPDNDGDSDFEYELARLNIGSSCATREEDIYARPSGEHYMVYTDVQHIADLGEPIMSRVSQSYAKELHRGGVFVITRVVRHKYEIRGEKLFHEKP